MTGKEVHTPFDVIRSSLIIKMGPLDPTSVKSLVFALWNGGFIRVKWSDSHPIGAELLRESDVEFSEMHWLTPGELLGFLESHYSDWINIRPFQVSERLAELKDGFSRLGIELRPGQGVCVYFPGSYMTHEGLQDFVRSHQNVFRDLLGVTRGTTGRDVAIFSDIRGTLTQIDAP